MAHFILSYLFHSHGLLLNLLGFPNPITTSLPLVLSAFKPTLFTNSFLWASLAHFYFLSISYNSHGLTTSFFEASSIDLLPFRPLIILWAGLPLFLPFWPNGLYFTAFFLHLFHIVGLLLPLGLSVKNGNKQKQAIGISFQGFKRIGL